jgi:hypothetical protein
VPFFAQATLGIGRAFLQLAIATSVIDHSIAARR